MLSPAEKMKLKSLTMEMEKKMGKEKMQEFMMLQEKSEDEPDEKEMTGSPKAAMDAKKLYPNQGMPMQGVGMPPTNLT